MHPGALMALNTYNTEYKAASCVCVDTMRSEVNLTSGEL